MAASLPVDQELTIYAGATFRRTFRWLPAGSAQDLTGWTARMQIRPDYTAAPVANLTTENGGITLGSDGSVALYLSATDTAAVPYLGRALLYDLALVQPNGGDVIRFLQGRVHVVREVTTS